jgi:hypothetical protein
MKYFLAVSLALVLLSSVLVIPVEAASTPSITVPSSTQVMTWINNLFASIEHFRTTEAVYFAQLREQSKATLGVTTVPTTPQKVQPQTTTLVTIPSGDAISTATAHPSVFFTYVYSSALAPVFASQILFYIVGVILTLIVLRFVVNLFA